MIVEPINFSERIYSTVDNIVFIRVKEWLGDYIAHKIYLTYCVGSSDECKQSTMLEF